MIRIFISSKKRKCETKFLDFATDTFIDYENAKTEDFFVNGK